MSSNLEQVASNEIRSRRSISFTLTLSMPPHAYPPLSLDPAFAGFKHPTTNRVVTSMAYPNPVLWYEAGWVFVSCRCYEYTVVWRHTVLECHARYSVELSCIYLGVLLRRSHRRALFFDTYVTNTMHPSVWLDCSRFFVWALFLSVEIIFFWGGWLWPWIARWIEAFLMFAFFSSMYTSILLRGITVVDTMPWKFAPGFAWNASCSEYQILFFPASAGAGRIGNFFRSNQWWAKYK